MSETTELRWRCALHQHSPFLLGRILMGGKTLKQSFSCCFSPAQQGPGGTSNDDSAPGLCPKSQFSVAERLSYVGESLRDSHQMTPHTRPNELIARGVGRESDFLGKAPHGGNGAAILDFPTLRRAATTLDSPIHRPLRATNGIWLVLPRWPGFSTAAWGG